MNDKSDELGEGLNQSATRGRLPVKFSFGLPSVAMGLWLAYLSAGSVRGQNLVPRVFNTGADDSGVVLTNYAVDPHYTLILSADANFPGPDTVVVDDTTFPIATGNWLANTADSKWIGPRGDQNYLADPSYGNAIGDYTYRTTIDLTGYNPDLVWLVGQWTCDSLGTDVKINGVSSSNSTPNSINLPIALQAWHPLLITSGFVTGTNILDFVITREPFGDASALPTGLRAEFVVSNLPPPQLQIIPAGDVVLVWWRTNNASGFLLETSASLGSKLNWSVFPGPIRILGDQNVVATDATAGLKFFRLRKP